MRVGGDLDVIEGPDVLIGKPGGRDAAPGRLGDPGVQRAPRGSGVHRPVDSLVEHAGVEDVVVEPVDLQIGRPAAAPDLGEGDAVVHRLVDAVPAELRLGGGHRRFGGRRADPARQGDVEHLARPRSGRVEDHAGDAAAREAVGGPSGLPLPRDVDAVERPHEQPRAKVGIAPDGVLASSGIDGAAVAHGAAGERDRPDRQRRLVVGHRQPGEPGIRRVPDAPPGRAEPDVILVQGVHREGGGPPRVPPGKEAARRLRADRLPVREEDEVVPGGSGRKEQRRAEPEGREEEPPPHERRPPPQACHVHLPPWCACTNAIARARAPAAALVARTFRRVGDDELVVMARLL